jgi:hypothetical protein
MLTETHPPQNSLLCDWSMFSSADSHWLQGKCARISLSQMASCMILQNHRRLPFNYFKCQNRRCTPAQRPSSFHQLIHTYARQDTDDFGLFLRRLDFALLFNAFPK